MQFWHLLPSFHYEKLFGNIVRGEQMEVMLTCTRQPSTFPQGALRAHPHMRVSPRLWWLSSSTESGDSSICLIWGWRWIDDDKDKPRNPIPNLTTMQIQLFFSFIIPFLPAHTKFQFLKHNNYIYYYKLFASALQHVQGFVYCLHSKQCSKEMLLSPFYWGSVTSRSAT